MQRKISCLCNYALRNRLERQFYDILGYFMTLLYTPKGSDKFKELKEVLILALFYPDIQYNKNR